MCLGIGLTALASIGIYAVTRGKAGSKPAKQIKELAEHIEFKEAKNMDEARKFAEENFGIKLELNDNLFIANLVNECCTNVSNKMKGKAFFPKKIYFDTADLQSHSANGGYNPLTNKITLNNASLGSAGYNFSNAFNNTLKTKNSYVEYIKQLENSKTAARRILYDMRHTVYHELGHCNHAATCKNWDRMVKPSEFEMFGNASRAITEEFLNDKAIQTTAAKVTEYAKMSPNEFVAEVFAGRLLGQTFTDDVMALYKKYEGPLI